MELHLGLVIFCPARFVFQNQKWPPPACESNKMLATTWGKFHMWHVCSSKPGTTIISSPKFECAGPTSYIFWTSLILCPPCFGFNTTPNVIFWFILKKKQKRILISKQVKTNSSGWHPICIEKRLMNSWSNCLIHNFRLKCIQKLPSLTTKIYPLPRHFCKMTFLFSRGGICDRFLREGSPGALKSNAREVILVSWSRMNWNNNDFSQLRSIFEGEGVRWLTAKWYTRYHYVSLGSTGPTQ